MVLPFYWRLTGTIRRYYCKFVIISDSHGDVWPSAKWGSLLEVVIPELSGWNIMIVVPPGWYKLLHSISNSEVVICKCRQCHLWVTLRDSSPWGCFQWVFVLAKHDMSISNWSMISHIGSSVLLLEPIPKLFIFWKRIRECLFFFLDW